MRTNSIFFSGTLLGLAVAFSACGGNDAVTPPPTGMGGMGGPVPAGTESRSQKLRITMPAVAAGQLQQLAGDERHFTANLYQAVRGADGNLIFSPESVSIAMGMLSGGAAGATAAQLAAAMQFSLPQAQLHPAFDALDLALASRGAGTAPGAFKLTALNALWAQNGFTILPAYLDLLAENYGAGVRRVDFAAMPEAARATVNQWVSSATGDKIPALLSPGDVQPDTRLILTNAVYFKAEWRSRFDKSRTRDGTFHTLVGTVTVPMMNAEGTVEYWRGDGYQAAALPYAGDSTSMVLIVPEAGTFAAFEGALDAAALDAILGPHAPGSARFAMPRFKARSAVSMGAALKHMGMIDAFDPARADFSGIDGGHDLYVGNVIHQAMIAVDEDGTEAAAATAVIGVGSAFPNANELIVDRPFLFAIRDNPTGSILFLGRVLDPGM